jgi:hypothetical protein
MDLKAQRQRLVRPHLALTKPGAVRLGPWMWASQLRDSNSLIYIMKRNPRPASWNPLLGEVWHPSLEGTMDGDHFQFYFYP